MTKKTHTTALGVPFDMAAFRAKNEKVRAVGNMNVNARGDVLDSNNNVIENRTKVVNRMYEKTMQSGAKPKRPNQHPAKPPAPPVISSTETTNKELEDLEDHIPNPKK